MIKLSVSLLKLVHCRKYTCDRGITVVANSDRSIELLGGKRNCSLTAFTAKQSPTRSTMMFPSSEPELCVATHTGAGSMVRYPQCWPLCVRIINCLPRNFACGRFNSGPSINKLILNIFSCQNCLWLYTSLCQRKPEHRVGKRIFWD